MAFVSPLIIEAARLRLQPVASSDLPEVLAMNSNAEVTRFLGHAPWKTIADAETWFQRISGLQAAGSALEFVIVSKESGGVIGRCGLFDYERDSAHASLGYILGRPYWRQGYMREALDALLECAFEDLGLRRLEARVEAGNTASSCLLQRLGFIKEGVLRERWGVDRETIDAEIYGLLRHEWPGPHCYSYAGAPDQHFRS